MIINLNLDVIGNALFILASMFFMHAVADFNLQGIMASMKQKTWWQKQEGYDEEDNGNDYKFPLFWHSLQWSFCIMLPLFIANGLKIDFVGLVFFCLNICCHYLIDDAKANKNCINLVDDQIIHILQIVATFIGYGIWMCFLK